MLTADSHGFLVRSMALYQYGSSSKAPPPSGKTEFEILKDSHRYETSLDSRTKVDVSTS
jgi:hypothetical protein